jgi:hypothetical protein
MPRVIREDLSYATASEVRKSDPDDVVEGCKLCGVEQDGHGYSWHAIYEGHRWQEPTKEQRQERHKKRRRNIAKRISISALVIATAVAICIVLTHQFQAGMVSVRAAEEQEVQRVDTFTQETINAADDVIVVLDDNSIVSSPYVNEGGSCFQYGYIVPARTIQSAVAAKYGSKPGPITGTVHPIVENDIRGAYTYIQENPNVEAICVYSHDRREVDTYLVYALNEVKDGFDDGTRVIGLPYHYGSVEYSMRTK